LPVAGRPRDQLLFPPVRAALDERHQRISRDTVEGDRPKVLAIARADPSDAIPRDISSRSTSVNANLERQRDDQGGPTMRGQLK
jgi:hypothetical protein